MVLILSFLFYKKEPLKPLIFYILNADALKKPTGQFTIESFWGPNWSGILRANIPFNCAAGQHIQINSIKGQNSEDIVLRGFGTANGYIALRTEETDKAFQGFTLVFTLT